MKAYRKEVSRLDEVAKENIQRLKTTPSYSYDYNYNAYIEWYYTDLAQLNHQYGVAN